MTLLYLVAAWSAGIFLASSRQTSAGSWLAAAGASLLLAYAVRRRRSWRMTLIYTALLALGAGRYAWAARPVSSDHIAHYADAGYVTFTGLVARDPDLRDKYAGLYVQAEKISIDHVEHPAQGMVLVQAPRYETYVYGDRVCVGGQLLTPPEFDTFSYRDYLARQGIRALVPNAEVEVVAHDQGRPWYALLYRLKDRAQHTIDRLLPSPQAPLLSGILLGNESGLSAKVRDAFNATGTAHIIAISGSNMIVVIGILMGLLAPAFGQRRATWITLLGVAAYTAFVGANPAVVRAAIMGGLSLWAVQLGRKAYGLTSLAFSIWLMSLWNPLVLWDVGFQLSIAATAGLVLFSRDLTRGFEKLLLRGFERRTVRQISGVLAEPLIVSVAAQITTTPLILLYFGRLSLLTLLANLLIVPAQAYVMTLGGLAVLFGMLLPVFGEPLAWVVWLPLSYTLAIVRALGHFEWASIQVNFSPSWAWGVYAALLGFALLWIQHPEDRAALFHRLRRSITTPVIIAAGGGVAVLIWVAALSQPDGKLHVWFLDVGQGNAVLIQTPRGAQILVDGGPNPTRLRQEVGDALPFWDRDLDVLVVTQPKSSAINALPALLDRYDVGLVVTNGQSADSDEYRALVRAWGTRHLTVEAGYHLTTNDGVTLEVLHPQVLPGAETDPDQAGLVLRVSYKDTSFLITPELDASAEEELLEAGWYTGSTVLVLPSHGSDKANPDWFLQAVHPQAAVALVEAGNRTELPAASTLDRLRALSVNSVYRTDQQGTVEMVTNGRTLWVYPER